MQLGLFPVHVQTADGTRHEQVRVYATDDATELWKFVNGQPTIIASGAGLTKQARSSGQQFSDGTKTKWVLQLADGTEWLVQLGGGCGCSDPMKRFDPAKAVRA